MPLSEFETEYPSAQVCVHEEPVVSPAHWMALYAAPVVGSGEQPSATGENMEQSYHISRDLGSIWCLHVRRAGYCTAEFEPPVFTAISTFSTAVYPPQSEVTSCLPQYAGDELCLGL